ncbi:MAG: S-methyl-5'-thioadenosine phosphorylase [Desulfobacteraceae bacterium]|nr:S-methyl-5'-thioadenosine phosphorylase [Desulfobacteraceae bacterium]
MEKVPIGIIGGSGVYDMEQLSDVEEVTLKTPFGNPSDSYLVGTLENQRVAFLPRHGRGHRILPTELNYRANIFGFKLLGVTHILSVTAVGSLREDIHPLDIVVPDQFMDRTRQRASTFFGDGLVAHIAFADPVCPSLSRIVYGTATSQGATVHNGGNLVCIEGPAFSTRAESELYRRWGMDIVGMTSLQEAKLAREAEICYVAMAMVTDYDAWHTEAEAVTVETVVVHVNRNADLARRIIREAVSQIPAARNCKCGDALAGAIMTDPRTIPADIKSKLDPLVGKYLGD